MWREVARTCETRACAGLAQTFIKADVESTSKAAIDERKLFQTVFEGNMSIIAVCNLAAPGPLASDFAS
jgi:hypothetical protein